MQMLLDIVWLWFLFNAVLTAAMFLFWYYERRSRPETAHLPGGLEHLSALRVVLGIVHETLAFMWMQLTMPLAIWGDRNQPTLVQDGQTPVLLVHGYACNSSSLQWQARRLVKAGYQVRCVSYRPPVANVHKLVPQIKAHIQQLLDDTGAEKIHYVCHSMGGVLVREVLADDAFAHRIDKVVCLGSPHHGTHAASLINLVVKGAIRQMTPASDYIQSLPKTRDSARFYGICSQMDNLVLPVTSAVLPGAITKTVDYLGHCALLYSPMVAGMILECLEE